MSAFALSERAKAELRCMLRHFAKVTGRQVVLPAVKHHHGALSAAA